MLSDRRETMADGNRFVSVEVSGTTNTEKHTLKQILIDGAEGG
jgi:hypothetical protein